MDHVDLSETKGGVVLPVRARPGAKRNAITGIHDGALKVSVTQVAEKGKANGAIIALLAKSLSLSKSQISIFSGASNSQKKLLITGLSLREVSQRVADAFT